MLFTIYVVAATCTSKDIVYDDFDQLTTLCLLLIKNLNFVRRKIYSLENSKQLQRFRVISHWPFPFGVSFSLFLANCSNEIVYFCVEAVFFLHSTPDRSHESSVYAWNAENIYLCHYTFVSINVGSGHCVNVQTYIHTSHTHSARTENKTQRK